MRIKKSVVRVCVVAFLAVVAAPTWAQGGPGPGPRGRGVQGFGWGPEEGVRFLGAGGCFFGERDFGKNKQSSTPYEVTVQSVDSRAVLNSTTPATHTDTYSVFRDSNGVTYLETTRNTESPKTLVCINDPANHVRFVVNLADPVKYVGTALEFKLPVRNFDSGNGQPLRKGGGKGGQNPPWNGKSNPNVTRVQDAKASDIDPFVASPPGSWFSQCGTGLDLTAIKRGQFQNVRIFCSLLGVNLYTSTSSPYGSSTVTGTIVSPPAALSLPVPYSPGQDPPLPAGITIKLANGRQGGRGPHGPPPPPQP